MDKKAKYQDQIDAISKQIVKEPDNVSLYIKRAELCHWVDFESNISKKEIELYKNLLKKDREKILRLEPTNLNDIFRQAKFFDAWGEAKQAINGYTQLINKGVKSSSVFYKRGLCFFNLKNYSNVVADLTNAEKLYQVDKDKSVIKIDNIYAYRGLSNYFLGKFSDAYSDFSKLLDKKTLKFKEIQIFKGRSLNQYPIPYYFAISCYFTGKYKEALIHLNEIIEADPQNYMAIFYRSKTYKIIGFQDKVVEDENLFEKALHKDSRLYEDIGKYYYEMNERDKALDCFRKVKWGPSKEAIEIIGKISNYYLIIREYNKAREACEGYMDNLDEVWGNLGYSLHEHLQSINDKQKDFEIFQAKIDERDRIIRNQAHDIKNIISTIIDPLMILKQTTKNPQIDRALKQAEVLSKMVNAVSLSYSGSEKDFYYDARHNSEGMSLKDMITSSVEASIGNIMQIVKYYKPFWEQYFPQYDLYEKALAEYKSLQEQTDNKRFELLINFLSKYMFDIAIEFGDSDALIIGDKKGSDIKLLTLFNEVIFNAIKYTAFVKKEDRIVSIKFNSSHEFINLEVENSLSGDTEVKSVGTGNLIIDNIINIMKGEVTRPKLNNRFITKIKFPNFWEDKNNGKDIIC